MATGVDVDLSTLRCDVNQTDIMRTQEMEQSQPQVDKMQTILMEIKTFLQGSSCNAIELEVLLQRVKTTAALLTHLKCKVSIIEDPPLAHALLETLDDKTCKQDSSTYMEEVLNSVNMVTTVMEILFKRAVIAETKTEIEKEKVNSVNEEVRKKTIQIESISSKLNEMQRFADGTNSILIEMRQRVEELVEETCRQRQCASDNENELSRVKQEFESLKSYVSGLISVREKLLSSEKQFQTAEKLFEQLVIKTAQLEGEKTQKEVEVQKMIEENMRLSTLLDKKEAQLLAMNEQCKVMALSASNI